MTALGFRTGVAMHVLHVQSSMHVQYHVQVYNVRCTCVLQVFRVLCVPGRPVRLVLSHSLFSIGNPSHYQTGDQVHVHVHVYSLAVNGVHSVDSFSHIPPFILTSPLSLSPSPSPSFSLPPRPVVETSSISDYVLPPPQSTDTCW